MARGGRILGYQAERVAAFILRFYAEHGRDPTYPEIRGETGIATNGEVSRIIRSLAWRGAASSREQR